MKCTIEDALRIYYSFPELSNKEIMLLCGVSSHTTVARIKNKIRRQMCDDGIPCMKRDVDTKTAFKVLNINVEDLEERLQKMRKLGIA